MYPVAAGLTSNSGTLIPEIWSMKTLVKFYTKTVFGAISNTDYEGEIKKYGDQVHIRTVPDITIRDYSIGQNLISERPRTEKITLYIDSGKYYNISVNLVELKQADIAYVEKWTNDAGEQMQIRIDSDLLANVYADASADNIGLTAGVISGGYNMGVAGTPFGLDKDNILDFFVDANNVLDEQDVPQTGRFAVLSTILCGLLKKSDIKDASLMGDSVSVARNGRIGMIDNTTIYRSNQIAMTADGSGETVYNIIFGTKDAITFASQMVENRVMENQNDFGKLMQGLQVYGYKVIKPEALVHGCVYKIS
jgi:hypothetical protein